MGRLSLRFLKSVSFCLFLFSFFPVWTVFSEGIVQNHPLYCLIIDNSVDMRGAPFQKTHAYVGALEKDLAEHYSKHELRVFSTSDEFREVGRMQSGLDHLISPEALGDVLNRIPDPVADSKNIKVDLLLDEFSTYLRSHCSELTEMPFIGVILWTRLPNVDESLQSRLLDSLRVNLPPLALLLVNPDVWQSGDDSLSPQLLPNIDLSKDIIDARVLTPGEPKLTIKTHDDFFYHHKRSSFYIETEGKGTFSNYRWYLNNDQVDEVSRGMTGILVEFKDLGAFYLQVAADYTSHPDAEPIPVESEVFVAEVVPQNGVYLIDPGLRRKSFSMGESIEFGFHYVGPSKSMVFMIQEGDYPTMNLLRCRKTPEGLREKLRCDYQIGFHPQPETLRITAKKGKKVWELGRYELKMPVVTGRLSSGEDTTGESSEQMIFYISDGSVPFKSIWKLPVYLNAFPLKVLWQLKDTAGDVLWSHVEADAKLSELQKEPEGKVTFVQTVLLDFSALPQLSSGDYQMQARLLLEDRGKDILLSDTLTELTLGYRSVIPSLALDYEDEHYDLLHEDWPNPFYVSDPSRLYWDFSGDLANFELRINDRSFSLGDPMEYWIRDEAFKVGSKIHLELTYEGMAGDQGHFLTDVIVARPHPFWLYLPLLGFIIICIGEGIYFFCGNQVVDWDLYYPTNETVEIDEIPSYENLDGYHRLPLKRFWHIWNKCAKVPLALFSEDEVQQYLIVRRGSRVGDDYLGQIEYRDEQRRAYQFKTYPSYANFSKFTIYEGNRSRSIFIDRHKSPFLNRYKFYFLILLLACAFLSYVVINYVGS